MERGKHILLVDDYRDDLEAMRGLLELWGHQVETVDNGVEAIAKVRSRRPDIVLIDLKMPGMSGHEVARSVREALGSRAPYLIAFTALSGIDDRELARAAGFDVYLVKPPNLDELRALLERGAPTPAPRAGRRRSRGGSRARARP